MNLTTEVKINKPDFRISENSVLTGIGSCFAEYVMQQFSNLQFNINSNPNGIVYNSYSIFRALQHISGELPYCDKVYFLFNGLWHSWMHHGSFSSNTLEELKDKVEDKTKLFKDTLQKSDIFILTPSSSVVYCLKENDKIVSNCHKYPGNKFYTKILSVNENLKYLSESINIIKKINPTINIVLTLSPVRHYPGDLCLNSISKSNLRAAIHLCIENFPKVYYFPSYEILIDELRDYRFYAEDMMHPSDLARKIIFEKFINIMMNRETLDYVNLKQKEYRKSQHRSIH